MTAQQASKALAGAKAVSAAVPQEKASPWTIGMVIVQIIIGYEWLVSGLVKIVRGDFTSGLGGELAEKAEDAYGWYASLLEGVIIPNASNFAVIIEIAEVLVGLAFIAVPLVWLLARERIPARLWKIAFLLTAVAAVGGFFMATNFHLANGLTHPWILPMDSFEEGVDFDTFLAAMNAVIAIVYFSLYSRFRGQEN
jgi:thiosulfate dehydrogenase [quinone] large subunit